MQRLAVCVAAVAAAGLGNGPAWHAPQSNTGAAAPERHAVCTIRDARLNEISGMAATRDGYLMVNDGSDDPRRRRIFFLDRACAVTRTVRYPSRPRDTEDLAVAADGTVWVADIGDNDLTRRTVGLWKLAPGAKAPRLYRVSYPDGAHDAEALLIDGDGSPIVVTKDPGTAGLYKPTRPLSADSVVPMVQAGRYGLPTTRTRNPFSLFGGRLVTGAATAPDGRRVVLRTYADAFEFDVVGGDVVRAVTTARPRVTALPDEPQGESIAYSTDGAALLTVSEVADQPAGTRPVILRYATAPASAASTPAATAGAARGTPARQSGLQLADVGRLIAALALLGLALAVAGAVGIRRAGRRTRRDRRSGGPPAPTGPDPSG